MTPSALLSPAPVVVIGAGLAGWTTVREFRKLDTSTPVLVVTADSGDFYAKPSLSNAFAQGRSPAQLVTTAAAKMAQALNVTLLPHTEVLALDTQAQLVHLASGTQPYRDLVLATGAQPIRVPLAGNAAAKVLSVNSLQDFHGFHAEVTGAPGADGASQAIGKNVIIMGAGLIGCEFANDLASAGHRVTVVDPGSRALAALLPSEASAQLQAALSGLGAPGQAPVQWGFGRTVLAVDRVEPQGAGQCPLQVTLSDGDTWTTDTVLSAIGLRADTRLAQAAGLRCERGIVVDAGLQTSAPHVYALGDAAQYSEGRTLPFVMPIMAAAKALARTLAGSPTAVTFPLMPVAVKTPALPLVVAPPVPGTSGRWEAMAAGEWHWLDTAGLLRGFVLSGAATPKRAKLAAAVAEAGKA